MANGARVFAQPQVYYYVVPSCFSSHEIHQLSRALEDGGAQPVSLESLSHGDGASLEKVTHIITKTVDFPEYASLSDPCPSRNLVRPEWIAASIAKGKQANSRHHSADPKMFFSGLIMTCADLPDADKDAIIGYINTVGGMYSSAITKQVTHIVALTTEADKCKAAIEKGLRCKIVLPHWIDNCLRLRARIDERPYCLPDPEVLLKGQRDKVAEADRPDLRGASAPRPDQLPTPVASPGSDQPPLTVFRSKTVMLHEDLGIGNSRLRGILEDLITGGGGSVTGSVHKADFLICHYRESQEFRIASRANKNVGNLSWLYHLITHNTWTSPMRRLLHYPIAKAGLPGFNRFRISVSNYNGEARVYLESLAVAAGAHFTKTMKDDNTHLITAHPHSDKCSAAKEWNIHLVNHLWLEESYARWQVQTLSNPIYTEFPPRTNLGEVVGQTDIDRKAVERHFFPLGSEKEQFVDEEARKHFITSKGRTPGQQKTSRHHLTSGVQDAPLRPLDSEGTTPKASRGRKRTDGAAVTPAAPAHRLGKENETPSTSGSRSAKAKAAAKLQDLAPDIALYEKETKRVGGVTHGGKRSTEDLVHSNNRKRSKSFEEQGAHAFEEDVKPIKRAKKTSGTPIIRLLLSGYKRWQNQTPKMETDDKARLKALGINVVEDPESCTHLASPKVIRTQKFICALAHAPIILDTRFVDDCLKQKRMCDPDQYLLKDKDFEKAAGFKLSDSVSRAENNQGSLLKGCIIYCTHEIHGGYDTYKAITEVNGGLCVLYRGRSGSEQALRSAVSEESSGDDMSSKNVYLLSGTTPDESKLWSKFRQMAETHGRKPQIVRHDWLLQTALFQQIMTPESLLA